jgi:hypothetical protein
MRQLQENSPQNFEAMVITRDRETKLHVHPLKSIGKQKSLFTAAQSDRGAIEPFANDQAFIQVVLDSIPNDGAALFVLADDDSSATLLTMLMLFSPNAMPFFMPHDIKQSDKADAHFHADLESYQAAIANLEVLRSDSTEGDVEVVFKAVDDAYDRLVRFFYPKQETENA